MRGHALCQGQSRRAGHDEHADLVFGHSDRDPRPRGEERMGERRQQTAQHSDQQQLPLLFGEAEIQEAFNNGEAERGPPT